MFETKMITNSLVFLPLFTAVSLMKIDIFLLQIFIWLIVIDFTLGVIKSLKLGTFDMAVLKAGILIKVITLCIPLITGLLLLIVGFMDDMDGYVMGVIRLLALNEGISALYSCASIISNKELDKPNLLKPLIDVIRRFFENLFRVFNGGK